jgi:hypothetical protein
MRTIRSGLLFMAEKSGRPALRIENPPPPWDAGGRGPSPADDASVDYVTVSNRDATILMIERCR